MLHALILVPAYWGVISHRWLVAEDLGRFELYRTLIGLGVNLLIGLMVGILVITLGSLLLWIGWMSSFSPTLVQLFRLISLNLLPLKTK